MTPPDALPWQVAETEQCVKKVKGRRARGPDGISSMALRAGCDPLATQMCLTKTKSLLVDAGNARFLDAWTCVPQWTETTSGLHESRQMLVKHCGERQKRGHADSVTETWT